MANNFAAGFLVITTILCVTRGKDDVRSTLSEVSDATDDVPSSTVQPLPYFWEKKEQLVDGYVNEINQANKSNPEHLLQIYFNYKTILNDSSKTPEIPVLPSNTTTDTYLNTGAKRYLEKLMSIMKRLKFWGNKLEQKQEED